MHPVHNPDLSIAKRSAPLPLWAAIAVLAFAYLVSGKLGLLLAVPPGYATVVWPPSGIAVAALLSFGLRLWPGVFLGSFILNASLGIPFSGSLGDVPLDKIAVAAGIAAGSTLQALLACALVARFLSMPANLKRVSDVILLLALAGPVACIVAATIGTAILYMGGIVDADHFGGNWLTWWGGDVLGVAIFLPIALFMPGRVRMLKWKGESVSALPLASMLVLLLPLGLTFYAWKASNYYIYERSRAQFAALAEENKNALEHRLTSYQLALDGGAGFFAGSNAVTRGEWRAYVEALDLEYGLPGINGIGYIAEVAPDRISVYERSIRVSQPGFKVRPETVGRPYYVIEMIEPLEPNREALGLNIGFEDNRLRAAERARDTGEPAITDRILLVQDETKSSGFLLLHPMYKNGHPLDTVEDRRQAFQGWIYAPFIGNRFMSDLTASQGTLLELRVFDGESEDPENLIYSSGGDSDPAHRSQFAERSVEDVIQQKWTLVWTSTPEFEARARSQEPLLILIGGLVFTGLFGSLLVFFARRAETVSELVALKTNEISANERQLRLLVKNTPAAVAMFDADLRYLMTSERWIRDYKLVGREIVGRSFSEVIPDGLDMPFWQDAFPRALAGETIPETESSFDRPDGRREWIKWAIHPWTDANGRVGGVVVFTEMITGRKATEARTQILKEVANAAVEAESVDAIFQSVLEKMCRYLAWQVGHAYVWNPTQELLVSSGIWHIDGSALPLAAFRHTTAATTFAPGVGLPGMVFAKARTLFVPDVATDPSFPRNSLIPDLRLHAGIGIPVSVKNEVTAVLELYSENHAELAPGDAEFLELLGEQLSRVVERRSFEEELARTNRLNNAVLDSADYMVVATDRDGKVLVFNKAAEQKSGYSAEEILDPDVPILWHDRTEMIERARELSEELGETIEPGFAVFVRRAELLGSDSHEWTFVRKDGERFPVNLTVTPLVDEGGQVVGFLGVMEDITLRRQQEAALRASEEMFRSAMEFASTGMALVDLDGRWVKVNPAFCNLLGYSEEKLLQMDFRAVTHPDDLKYSLAALQEFTEGTRTTLHAERRYIRSSGRVIWVLTDVSVAYNPDGTKKGYIAQFQDITERKEMERMKSEFVSVVSHELRTPLTSIRGSLGLVTGTMSDKIPDPANKLIGIAHKNCERLILLINDILDMDKIATGHMRFDMEEQDLSEIVAGAVESNRAYAQALGIDLQLRDTLTDARANIDAARLAQVLANLISNAAKFSPAKGEVHVSLRRSCGRFRISVRDFGKGVPGEFQERIFDRFSQADSSVTREKGGTGLGLHISKQLMERMGGTIGFESEPNKGTTFWVEVPEIDPEIDAAAPAAEEEKRLAG